MPVLLIFSSPVTFEFLVALEHDLTLGLGEKSERGNVREFRDGGDRFCMGAFNQKMTRQKIKFHSCRVTSSSCALVLLHSQPPSKPHSSNTIPGLFHDNFFLPSVKNESICQIKYSTVRRKFLHF